MDRERVVEELQRLVGAERVVTEEAALRAYAEDLTEAEARQPALAVKPTTTEQVQGILRLANAERLPVTPVVANTNVGGLAIPVEGGLVVDLRDMNRILTVDETAMYALLEPGVTFGDLAAYLDEHHPDLIAGYALSPPEASVLCNCLLDGLLNLSFRHGPAGEWINGLEAVLPTGEIVRTGSAALRGTENQAGWWGRSPLPDLTGLFVSWQGTTGIVTKLAVQLWPKPTYRQRMFVLAYDQGAALRLMRELARSLIFDDLGGVSWPLSKRLFGIERPLERDPDEPEFYLYVDLSAHTQEEMRAKEAHLQAQLTAARSRGIELEPPVDIPDLIRLSPALGRFAEFPMRLDFLLDRPGGLSWVGTYGPTAQWEAGAQRGAAILRQHGFSPMVVTRSMRGGHFGVLRFIIPFDKADAAEARRVRQTNLEVCEAVLDLGFIPYKAPAWAVERLLPRLDPGFVTLLRTIKRTLDPNGIMNPGRWP